MLLRIKPACRFSFHYTFQRCHVLLQIARSPTLLFFQRCHMLLQITRSPTLLFFCSFLWLFLSYTRDFISLRVTDSHLPQSVFPGEFPRRKLNYLLIRRLAVKIEFTGGRQARQNCFLLLFCCSCPSVSSLRLEQIAYLAQVSPFRSRPYLLSFIGQEQPVPCSATRNTSLRLTSASFGLTPSPDTASLASRILTSRPTYAEKLQGYKNLSPRSNTLPLAGHANTSFLTFAVPKKT